MVKWYQRRCMYQVYRRWQCLFYLMNFGWIMDWSDICRIVWDGLIQVGVIWINVNRFGIFMIPNYRISAPNFFNFKIIFSLSISEIFVASRVLTLNFWCSMPRRYPVGNIRRPSEKFKYVAVACRVRLCNCGHNRSLWVYPSAVINILPEYGNISTTIQTPKGEIWPITVSWSGCLVGVDGGELTSGVLPICCVITEWVRDTYQ